MDISARILPLLDEAAQTFIIPRFRALTSDQIYQKDDAHGMTISVDDLATVADQEAESFLTQALIDLLPGSLVVGEEAAADDPRIIEWIDQEDGYVWVIDPLDGTANFVAGCEEFCTMLALRHKGETILSFIHSPLTGQTLLAEKGNGAYLNGEGLLPLLSSPLFEMSGFVGKKLLEQDHAGFQSALKSLAGVSTAWCAGIEYMRMAQGHAQFCLYKKVLPWDHLPGTFICSELGAFSAQWDGQPYPQSGYDGGLLTTASKEGWHTIDSLLVAPLREKTMTLGAFAKREP